MRKRMSILIALAVLAMVGAASAAETVDELEIRGSIVDAASGISPVVATWVAGDLHACTWDSYDFAAFWYDVDDNLWTEMLTIYTAIDASNGPLDTTQRVLDEGELMYHTASVGQAFVACKELGALGTATGTGLRVKGAEPETCVDEDGDILAGGAASEPETCYHVVGWMTEKYIGVDGRADTLAKLLVEFEGDDKKTLATGEEWDLGEGFTLTVKEIHPEGNTVWLQLNKSGEEIDSTIVGRQNPTEQDMLYVVTKDIAGRNDVPIFVAYVDAMINGTDANIVQLKYVWLMSDEAIEIECGDEFGALEVTMASAATVILQNDNSITLTAGVVDVCGDVKFKVADDSNTIRFYPMVEKTEPGTYEIRGSIVDTAACTAPAASVWATGCLYCCTWRPYDFAAFWYDLDDDLLTETLVIDTTLCAGNGPLDAATDQRVLDEDELIYTTVPCGQAFVACRELATTSPGLRVKGAESEPFSDYDGDGISNEPETCYNVVGWMAETYVGVDGRADTLAKLLVEFESTDKKTLATGESWDMGGGFSLTAMQIDLEGNKVQLQLNKSGTEIDSAVIGRQNPTEQDMLYVVTMDEVGGKDDVPIFVAYVDAISNETNTIQLKYVWLMSDEAIEINDGDEFDALKVTTADVTTVILKNDNSIALYEDAVIDVCGGMKFKVADDDTTIRFYPFVERTIGGVAPTPPPDTIPATDTDGDGVPDVWDMDNSTQEGYWVNPQGIGRMWGDMNGDGRLTSVDALMILQAVAGKIGL